MRIWQRAGPIASPLRLSQPLNQQIDAGFYSVAVELCGSPNPWQQAPADTCRVIAVTWEFGLENSVLGDGAVEQERQAEYRKECRS